MNIIKTSDFIEVTEEKIIEKKIKCDVSKLEPGYYEVIEEGTTGRDIRFSFVITTWNYGGANYIIIKEVWKGSAVVGTCVVETSISDKFKLNKQLEELLSNEKTKVYKI